MCDMHAPLHKVAGRELCADVAGHLFVQSDVEAVAAVMRHDIEQWAGHVLQLQSTAQSMPFSVRTMSPSSPSNYPQQATMADQHHGNYAGRLANSIAVSINSDAGFADSAVAPADATQYADTRHAVSWSQYGWLVSNPWGAPTEREYWVQYAGRPVYRFLAVKTRDTTTCTQV